MLVTS